MNCLETVIFAILEVALRSLRNAYSFVGNSRQIGSTLVGLGEKTTSRARPCLAVALSIVLALCITSLVTTPFVQAADPGHAASRISAGTFEAGNFVFPDNLTINDFLTVNATTLYVDAVQGYVGIWTASPSAPLHIYTSGASLRIGDAAWSSDETRIIEFMSGSTVGTQIRGYSPDGSTTDLAFHTYSGALSEQMRIKGNGDVGIGTESPGSLLQINETPGDHSANPTLSFGDGDTGLYESSDDDLVIGRAGVYWFSITSSGIISGAGKGPLIAQTTASATVPTLVPNREDTDTGIGGNASDNLSIITGGIEAIKIDSSQRVGIGTASPGALLHLNATNPVLRLEGSVASWDVNTTNSGQNFIIRDVNNNRDVIELDTTGNIKLSTVGTERMRIDTNGDVGIGTTNPSELLHLDSTSNTTQIIEAAPNNDSTLKLLEQGTGDVGAYLKYDGVNNRFGIWVGNDPPTEKLTILRDSNYVGINDTTPSYTLDVNGTIRATSDILIDTTSVCQSDGTNCPSGMANSSAWNRSGSNVFLANSGDSVGIGTESPTYDLHINGTTNPQIGVEDSTNSVKAYLASTDDKALVGSDSEHDFAINTNSTVKVTIDTSGNVGVGTDSPVSKLTVRGTDATSETLVTLENSGGAYEVINLSYENANTGKIEILRTGSVLHYIGENGVIFNEEGLSKDIRFEGNTSENLFFLNGSADSIGIGTASPTTKLHVSGAVGITDSSSTAFAVSRAAALTNPIFVVDTSTDNAVTGINITGADDGNGVSLSARSSAANENLFIDAKGSGNILLQTTSTGDVGIGTTNPSEKLHVYGTSQTQFMVEDNGTTDVQTIVFSRGDLGYGWVGTRTNHPLYIGTGYSGNIFIENGTGNVGIGTTSPATILHIEDTEPYLRLNDTAGGDAYELRLDSGGTLAIHNVDDNSNPIYVQSDGNVTFEEGNVGIGTASPQSKLTIMDGNVSIGYNTSASANTLLVTSNSVWSGAAGYDAAIYGGLYIGGGSSQNTIIYSGDVGIGTASPSTELHLNGTTPFFTIESDADNTDMGIYLKENGGNNMGTFWYDGSESLLRIETFSASRDIYMDPGDGGVGIRDEDPDAPLEINSTTTPQFRISHTDGVDYGDFAVDSDGNLTISASSGNVIIQVG